MGWGFSRSAKQNDGIPYLTPSCITKNIYSMCLIYVGKLIVIPIGDALRWFIIASFSFMSYGIDGQALNYWHKNGLTSSNFVSV